MRGLSRRPEPGTGGGRQAREREGRPWMAAPSVPLIRVPPTTPAQPNQAPRFRIARKASKVFPVVPMSSFFEVLQVSAIRDVIILGSGPAGYTAALYTARANLKPLLFTGLQPGGQLTITTDVENYPGFPNGIQGPELMDLMRAQVARFGAEIVDTLVDKVDFSKRPFTVWSDGQAYQARSIIVATGASALLLNLPSEQKFMGFGVSACATCDGFFYKGKRIIVVGGGDTAMEEATYLTRFSPEVIVVHRRDSLRASKIMQERARANARIRFLWNSEIVEVYGEEGKRVTGVKLRDTVTGALTELASDA